MESGNELNNFVYILSYLHSFPYVLRRYLNEKDSLPKIATGCIVLWVAQILYTGGGLKLRSD